MAKDCDVEIGLSRTRVQAQDLVELMTLFGVNRIRETSDGC